MKILAALLGLLTAAVWSGPAAAQCAGGLVPNCPAAVNPQPTDLLMLWQNGQTPHSRSLPLSGIGTPAGGGLGEVQFYGAGAAFAGDSTFTFNSSTKAVTAQSLAVTGAGNAITVPATSGIQVTILNPQASNTLTINGATTMSGVVTAKGLTGTGPTYTLSGSAAPPPVINIASSYNGTSTYSGAPFYYNNINIPTDTAHLAAAGGLLITENFGGAGFSGNRIGLGVALTQAGATPNGNAAFVGGAWDVTANASMGGTGSGNQASGTIYGINPQVNCVLNATNLYGCIGSEFDMSISGSASANKLVGISVIVLSNHTNAAALDNEAIFIAAQRPTGASNTLAPLTYALALGGYDGQWAFGSSSILEGTRIQSIGNLLGGAPVLAQTASIGTDWGAINFATAAFRSPGWLVDPAGCIYSGDASLCTSTTTATFDVAGRTGATTTLSVAGTGYQAGEITYDTFYDGIFSIDTVNGSGVPQTFHWIQPPHYFGGSPPSTLALTGGSGSQTLVANITWTQGTTIGIGTSVATAINIGNSGTTTNIVGSVQAGGTAGVTCSAGVPSSSFTAKNGIVTHC